MAWYIKRCSSPGVTTCGCGACLNFKQVRAYKARNTGFSAFEEPASPADPSHYLTAHYTNSCGLPCGTGVGNYFCPPISKCAYECPPPGDPACCDYDPIETTLEYDRFRGCSRVTEGGCDNALWAVAPEDVTSPTEASRPTSNGPGDCCGSSNEVTATLSDPYTVVKLEADIAMMKSHAPWSVLPAWNMAGEVHALSEDEVIVAHHGASYMQAHYYTDEHNTYIDRAWMVVHNPGDESVDYVQTFYPMDGSAPTKTVVTIQPDETIEIPSPSTPGTIVINKRPCAACHPSVSIENCETRTFRKTGADFDAVRACGYCGFLGAEDGSGRTLYRNMKEVSSGSGTRTYHLTRTISSSSTTEVSDSYGTSSVTGEISSQGCDFPGSPVLTREIIKNTQSTITSTRPGYSSESEAEESTSVSSGLPDTITVSASHSDSTGHDHSCYWKTENGICVDGECFCVHVPALTALSPAPTPPYLFRNACSSVTITESGTGVGDYKVVVVTTKTVTPSDDELVSTTHIVKTTTRYDSGPGGTYDYSDVEDSTGTTTQQLSDPITDADESEVEDTPWEPAESCPCARYLTNIAISFGSEDVIDRLDVRFDVQVSDLTCLDPEKYSSATVLLEWFDVTTPSRCQDEVVATKQSRTIVVSRTGSEETGYSWPPIAAISHSLIADKNSSKCAVYFSAVVTSKTEAE